LLSLRGVAILGKLHRGDTGNKRTQLANGSGLCYSLKVAKNSVVAVEPPGGLMACPMREVGSWFAGSDEMR